MWFHRPFRADDWLLYHQDTPSASDGRGIALRADLHAGRRPGRVGRAGRPAAGQRHVSLRRARARGLAEPGRCWLRACSRLLGGCASGSSIGGAAPTTTTTTATKPVGAAASLVVPALEPDGSFPSVAAPDRDGSLRGVRTKLVPVAKVDAPMALVARPRHPDELFIAERAGRILLARRRTGAAKLAVTSSIRCSTSPGSWARRSEEGMLGLAFDRTGGVLYVSYNLRNGDSKVDAVTVTDARGEPRLADPAQRAHGRPARLPQPQGRRPPARARRLPLLRPRRRRRRRGPPRPRPEARPRCSARCCASTPRTPPPTVATRSLPDNPYAHGGAGEPETWLTGLRNPWRFAFDPANGDLWIGDVGQSRARGDRPASRPARPGAPTSAGAGTRAPRCSARVGRPARRCRRSSRSPTPAACAPSPAAWSTAAPPSPASRAPTSSATSADRGCTHSPPPDPPTGSAPSPTNGS